MAACESYSELLSQSHDVNDGYVRDTFHLTCYPQSLGSASAVDASLSEDDVSSFLSSLNDWNSTPRHYSASLAA